MRRTMGLVGFFFLAAQVHAQTNDPCNFCTPQTLIELFRDASILVIGRVQRSTAPNDVLPIGEVEIVVEEVIIPHELVQGRKTIFVPGERKASNEKLLIALDINKGRLESRGGTPLDTNGEILKFVLGAVKGKDKSAEFRIRHSLDHLRYSNNEIADAAHKDVMKASLTDLRQAIEGVSPAPWLNAFQNPQTVAYQLDTYAILLGLSGTKEHADILKKHIDDGLQIRSPNLADLMFGYVLVDPEIGWKYVTKVAFEKDQKFSNRYSALKTIRKVGAECKDICDDKKCFDAIARFLTISDMADLAIEDLRKASRWEHRDAVLDLNRKPGYDRPVIRRAVLRYAILCPSPAAKALVATERSIERAWVEETIELLALEEGANPLKK